MLNQTYTNVSARMSNQSRYSTADLSSLSSEIGNFTSWCSVLHRCWGFLRKWILVMAHVEREPPPRWGGGHDAIDDATLIGACAVLPLSNATWPCISSQWQKHGHRPLKIIPCYLAGDGMLTGRSWPDQVITVCLVLYYLLLHLIPSVAWVLAGFSDCWAVWGLAVRPFR